MANYTAATAYPMEMPYALTQDASLSDAPNYDCWFSFTFAAGTVEFGFLATTNGVGAYTPITSVFTGPVESPVPYLIANASGALQVPSGTPITLYMRVRSQGGTVPDTPLLVSGWSAPRAPAPVGTILVNDDTEGFPAVLISGEDGSTLQFRPNIPAGEAGDILSTGEMLFEDFANSETIHFSADLETQTVLEVDSAAIRTQRALDIFYVGDDTNPAKIYTVDAAGTLSALIATLSARVWGMAANNDGTILYWSLNTTGSPLKRWDLDTDMAMADLVAATVTPSYFITDFLVLDDDSIIAGYCTTASSGPGPRAEPRHYDPDGTLLATYGPYLTEFPAGTQPRLAYAPGTSDSFWLFYHPDEETNRFIEIQVSDGATLQTVDSPVSEGGEDGGGVGEGGFGTSFSCPFIITTVPIGGEEPPNPSSFTLKELVPRRQRRAAHLSADQFWTFYSQFYLDLEAGRGLTAGQGSDPQIVVRWSDDGGHTWSQEHWMSAGARGQYAHRSIIRRLGRARDRIFQIDVSDPIGWNILAAYIDVEQGSA